MPRQTVIVRNAHAAQRHMIARAELVHVKAHAGSNVGKVVTQHRFSSHEIVGSGEFDIRRFAGECGNPKAGPFHQCAIVGEVVAALALRAPMRIEQRREGESLRRLHRAQFVAIDSSQDHAIRIDGP